MSYFSLAANKLIKKGVVTAMAICFCNLCNGNGMKVPLEKNPGTSTPFQFMGIANAADLCCCFFSCLVQLRYAKALSPVCVGMFP